MALLGPSPQTSTSSGTSTTTFNPSQQVQGQWNGITNNATAMANALMADPMYHGQMVADQDELFQQYQGLAGTLGNWQPNTANNSNAMISASGDMYNTQVNPNNINLPSYNASSFQPGAINMPQFGAVPTVNAPTAATPNAYQTQQVQAPQAYTPQQVSAMMVNAPGAINQVSGVQNVQAPQLNQYQMQAAQNISAPQLQNYQMQAAANVAPNAQAQTQSWTSPGTAQQYMNPYVQQVVNTQLAQAQTQEQQQLAQQGAQAAQAGAFGGSRQGVEEANTSIGYQQLASQLQAQGLQNAYSQGMQQFQQEQGLGLQAQTTNIQAGLQAALANQQAQQQANTQNLAANLQTQGLGTQAQMQAALANQSNQQQANVQNLSSYLQTQGLGAQVGMQAQLANQAMSNQTQVENQQAQEFGYGQQMQAGLANQQANLQAQGMNQSAGLQAGLANEQYQYGASSQNASAANQAMAQYQQLQAQMNQANAGYQLTAGQGNQAANMQAQGMQYTGGLQAGMQTQNLGLSGAEYGGSLGLQAAAQNYGLQQSQQGLNMQALMNSGALQNQAANLSLQNYNTDLSGAQVLGQAGQAAQSWDQSVRDSQYQNWQNSIALPMQAEGYLANITAMQQQPYSQTTNYSGTSTMMPSQPSILQQALTGGIGIAGALGNWFGAKGGRIPDDLQRRRPSGLGRLYRPRPESHGLKLAYRAAPQEAHGLARAA